MVNRVPQTSACPGCGAATRVPMMCVDCFDAFSSAKRSHPSAREPMIAPDRPEPDVALADDVELWDAWALLGDVVDRTRKSASN